jgi:hypothetical protein
MRNISVRVCNVVVTPDFSRPLCSLKLYNINLTIYKAGGGSVSDIVVIGLVDRRLATPWCQLAEEKSL